MSKAALASVQAHLLISLTPKEPSQITTEILAQGDALKRQSLKIAQQVIDEVTAISFAKGRQALWVAHNAIGNAHLNFSRYLEKHPDPINKAQQLTELKEAEKAFETCRTFTAPTAELYSNLATVKLFLGDYDRCQKYCEAAIRCEPNYEYAYYRMAGSYEIQEKWDEILAVKERFGKQPNITGFKAIVAKAREKTQDKRPAQ